MAERVATGEIFIDLHDEESVAGLRRIEQQFDRTMDKIDREKATAKIDADYSGLTKSIKQAERELRDYEKRYAEADKSSRGGLAAQIKLRKDNLAAMREEQKALSKQRDAQREQNREYELTERRLKAIEKREQDIENLRTKAHQKERIRAQRMERLRERAEQQRLRERSDWDRMHQKMERELRTVPKLEAAYVRMHDRLEKLAQAKRSARGDKASIWRIEFDEKQTRDEIARLGSEIRRIAERDPIDIPLKRNMGDRWGRQLRFEFDRAGGHLPTMAAAVGRRLGSRLGRGIADGTRDTLDRGLSATVTNLGKRAGLRALSGVMRGISRAGHAVGGLADMTIRLGPFTASVRQAFFALSLFAPVLLDVAGAASAFVGSLGAATLGVGALGLAIAGGAVPAFAGMGFVIARVVKEFSAIKAAQKAYDDAIRKGNTDLAKDKMKELQATMGNVSKETVRQVGQWSKLNDTWKKLTEPAKGDVFRAMGEGVKTASALLPMFAKNTNQAMDTAVDGVTKWMQALRSAEGQRVLDTMMDNFNEALGPALAGMGDLVGYLGRVGAIASKSLPGLARTFRDWAEGLNSVSETELEQKVEGVIDSAKTMGRFFLSAGRLIKEFFGAGVEAGDELTETMTNAMDRWREGFQTPQGQNNLRDFFEESVRGAQAFYNALRPIISSFINWARSIAPFARAFLDGAAAVGDFVHELLQLTGLQSPLTAIVTTLGGLWALGKIRTATTAIGNFVGALTGLGRTAGATAASAGRRNIADAIFPPVAVRNVERGAAAAAKAAPKVGLLARAGSAAKTGLSGLGALALGVSSPLAGAGVLAAGAAAGIFILANRTDDWQRALDELDESMEDTDNIQRNLDDSARALAGGYNATRQAALQVKAAEAEVNRLRKAGKQGTDEYRMAVANLKNAYLQQGEVSAASAKATAQSEKQIANLVGRRTDEYEKARDAMEELNDETAEFQPGAVGQEDAFGQQIFSGVSGNVADVYKEIARHAKSAGVSVQEYVEANEDMIEDENEILAYADALDKLNVTQDNLRKAQQEAVLWATNQERAFKGMGPIARKAAADVEFLTRRLGSQKTQKIALKFQGAEDATRVARSAANALRNGVPKSVTTRIVANSNNADAAVRNLQRAQITPKKLEIITQGNERAVRVLQDIMGRKLTPKELKIVEKGGDNVLAKIRQIGDNAKSIPDAETIAEIRGNDTVNNALRTVLMNVLKIPDHHNTNVTHSDDGILGFIGDVISKINGIDTYIEIVAQWVTRGSPPKTNAAGRPAGVAEKAFVGEGSDWKGAREYTVDMKSGLVQRFEAPTLTDVNANTAVIPTEPKYRDRGRSIFKDVARDLGIRSFAGGQHPNGPGVGQAGGQFSNSGFEPGVSLIRESTFKPIKKKNLTVGKASKQKRWWNHYVGELQTQQEYWEREVSIQESKVREPENMVIRAPENDYEVVDPNTGEKVIVEAYKANPQIDRYEAELDAVLKAMHTLMEIVAELVRAIPQAILASGQERRAHGIVIDNLKDERTHAKNRLDSMSDADRRDHPDKYQRRKEEVEKLDRKIKDEQQIRDDLEADEKLLEDARVEAGFSYREADIARESVQRERDSARGDAVAEAQQQTNENIPTASTGGGGGGSGGAGGISYGSQVALADTERANILREFGSNFIPTIGAAWGSQVMGGGGAGMGAKPPVRGAPSMDPGGFVGPGGVRGGPVFDARPGATGRDAAAVVAGSRPRPGATADDGSPANAGSGGNVRNVTINNTFANVPPDPLTWSKGVEFEIGASV